MKPVTRRKIRKKKNSPRLFFMLASCVAVFAAVGFLRSGFFSVTAIEVQGAGPALSAEVLRACPLKEGDHTFSCSKSAIRTAVMDELVQVKDVRVERTLPSSVRLIVEERTAAMAVSSGSVYWLADEDGFVFAVSDKPAATGALIISGLEGVEPSLGGQLDVSRTPALRTAWEVVSCLKRTGTSGKASELLIDKDAYYLYTSNSNVVKFVTLKAFTSNEGFVEEFLNYDQRRIMVELVEGRNPVYKVISVE